MSLESISSFVLGKAAKIKERIETLEKDLEALLDSGSVTIPVPQALRPSNIRKMSAAGRARIAAAARARWAKVKAGAATKPKRKMSAAGRAKIAAAARARWKKAKAAGKNSL